MDFFKTNFLFPWRELELKQVKYQLIVVVQMLGPMQ
jgi:hypothetical protein